MVLISNFAAWIFIWINWAWSSMRCHNIHWSNSRLTLLFRALLVLKLATLRKVADLVKEACLGAKLIGCLDCYVFKVDIVIHVVELIARLRIVKLVHHVKACFLVIIRWIPCIGHNTRFWVLLLNLYFKGSSMLFSSSLWRWTCAISVSCSFTLPCLWLSSPANTIGVVICIRILLSERFSCSLCWISSWINIAWAVSLFINSTFTIGTQSGVVDSWTIIWEHSISYLAFVFILNYNFFEQCTFFAVGLLIAALFVWSVLIIIRLLIATRLLIKIGQINFVTVFVLIFKSVKTSAWTFLQEELRQVTVRNKIIGFLANNVLVNGANLGVVEIEIFVLRIQTVLEVVCVLVLTVLALLWGAEVGLLLVSGACCARLSKCSLRGLVRRWLQYLRFAQFRADDAGRHFCLAHALWELRLIRLNHVRRLHCRRAHAHPRLALLALRIGVDEGGRVHLLLLQLRVALHEALDLSRAHSVEVGVSQALDGGEALVLDHVEHASHEAKRLGAHLSNVLLFERLGLAELWELEADEARVGVELFLKSRRQFAHDFLNTEKLINFALTRK